MKTNPYVGKKVQIRLMTDEDLQYLLKANHNPNIEQLSWGIYPMYPEELKEFYENEKKTEVCVLWLKKRKLGKWFEK